MFARNLPRGLTDKQKNSPPLLLSHINNRARLVVIIIFFPHSTRCECHPPEGHTHTEWHTEIQRKMSWFQHLSHARTNLPPPPSLLPSIVNGGVKLLIKVRAPGRQTCKWFHLISNRSGVAEKKPELETISKWVLRMNKKNAENERSVNRFIGIKNHEAIHRN